MKKKALFLLVGLQVMISAAVQEVLAEIATQQEPQKKSFTQKIKEFNKVVEYLNKARDCLSGIGCSKRKSYLANFALGAAIGFGNGLMASLLIQKHEEERSQLHGTTTREEMVEIGLTGLDLIAIELGYRYLVKDKVQLFQCLTFRGCSEPTKRYAFFKLGSIPSFLTAILSMGQRARWGDARKWAEGFEKRYVFDKSKQKWKKEWRRKKKSGFDPQGGQETVSLVSGAIRIQDIQVKNELGLAKDKDYFYWYEVFGFDRQPNKSNARQRYRALALKYHPDSTKLEDKDLAQEVFKAIAEAGEYY